MSAQIQSLLNRRKTARIKIVSILAIGAEDSVLKGVFNSWWFDLDSIDNELRKHGIEPFKLENHEQN